MKRTALLAFFVITGSVFSGCADNAAENTPSPVIESETEEETEIRGDIVKPGEVQWTSPLNEQWVSEGKNIYESKCKSCHAVNEERIVGQGWKGITTRREPHWLMNMITNVDIMLETDAEAQSKLEECIVRTPLENLQREQARKVLEFMRKNDSISNP